jgi:hypothetical protein
VSRFGCDGSSTGAIGSGGRSPLGEPGANGDFESISFAYGGDETRERSASGTFAHRTRDQAALSNCLDGPSASPRVSMTEISSAVSGQL